MAGENSRIKMRLPRDILFSILRRLPLKSVLRFCCVSKYWFNVIMDPDFRNLHFFQSPTEPTALILSQRKLLRENVISMNLLNLKDHKVHVSDNAISHMVGSHSFNLVGTCNGLLCFTSFDQGESICVGNPITRELVTLPKPSRTASPEPCTLVYGFGFDCLTKKYKVVRIFHPTLSIPESFRFGNLETRMTAEVYTLGATGSWKAVQGFDRPPFGQPVFANGAVHWVVHPRFALGRENDKIISFDISKDEFTATRHPKFVSTFSIAELRGCLSVVADIMSILIKVWMLKDHVTNHWEQEYIFPINNPSSLDRRFPRLISIYEQNEVLLIWLQDGLYSYERRTLRRKMLKISGFPTWLDWEVCSGFRGSLVPPGAYCDNGGGENDAAYFVSNMELYSRPVSALVCEQENVGRSQALVTCFTKNRMLVD
ncbi:F-box/kelch-repeat protein At3g23880-like [Phoenix dactylifera]|uniref:F-box/kelch-repeat protein At3g23880-like n=1 Tax=Phoenix dactylifera TaxID=42345 RepID=A0A8B7CRH6_PHODC|nr:F-box/kelch-repeat protein At3g23880-like [Phoenix dactylifera]